MTGRCGKYSLGFQVPSSEVDILAAFQGGNESGKGADEDGEEYHMLTDLKSTADMSLCKRVLKHRPWQMACVNSEGL